MLKRLFKKKSLIFRLDDIAPNMKWEMMNKVENLFDRYQIKPIMGVIPKNEDNFPFNVLVTGKRRLNSASNSSANGPK